MRKMILAVAATAALTSAAFLANSRPAEAQALSVDGPLTALQNGDLQAEYARRGGGGRGGYGGRAAYRGGGAYRGRAAYRGGYGRAAYRGGYGRAAYRGGYGGAYYGRPYYGYGYGRGYNYGGAAAAGAVGLATGAIVGGAIAQQQAPVYAAPSSSVSYCMNRFRSYNPATGTYLGNDGLRHACP